MSILLKFKMCFDGEKPSKYPLLCTVEVKLFNSDLILRPNHRKTCFPYLTHSTTIIELFITGDPSKNPQLKYN